MQVVGSLIVKVFMFFCLQELIGSEPIPIDIAEHADSDSDGEEWSPEPIDANIGRWTCGGSFI